ncbi:MAG: hypothetical protein Q8907_11700, partial [Bacteroidota bacterium]|nr:hypothetical protein [Bacteroidota bacterium]
SQTLQNIQNFKERLISLPSKNIKNLIKYIVHSPAFVVQHGLIAGSCRPLRVLFIIVCCI